MTTFNEAMLARNRTFSIRVGSYTNSDIKEAQFSYGYIAGDTFKPGGTVAGSAQLIFSSIIPTFKRGDKIYPEIGLQVGDEYEWVAMGEYFINDINIDRNRNTTALDLMDGMFKLNQPFLSDLSYPAQIRDVIREICAKTGVVLETEDLGFRAIQHHIQVKPEKKDITFREVLSQSIQLLGFSAFFNRKGRLEIRGLTASNLTITADNYFMHGLTKSEIEYQIAGITCKKDKETLMVGLRTGRSLELENSFMIQNILDDLYYDLKNIKYYPYSLDWQGHLKLEVGQRVTLKTNKDETYKVPVLSQSFTFKGGLKSKISADSKSGNDTQYSYKGFFGKRIEQMSTEIAAEVQQQLEYADRVFGAKEAQLRQEIGEGLEETKGKIEAAQAALNSRLDHHLVPLASEAKRLALQGQSDLRHARVELTGLLQTYKESEPDRRRAYFEASREETSRQLSTFRTEVSGSYVAKSTYEANARSVLRRFESLSSGGQNYALGTETDVSLSISGSHVYDLYSFGRTLAVKGVELGEDVSVAFNYFSSERVSFGSFVLELHGATGFIERLAPPQTSLSSRGTYTARFVATNANFRATSLKIRFTDSQLRFRVTTLRVTKGSIPSDWSPAPDDIKAYSDNKLTQFRSQVEQTSREIKASVTSLNRQVVKQADVTLTAEGIVLKAGKSSSDVAKAIGSYFALTPDAISLFSPYIKVKGDMLVDGSISGRKLLSETVSTHHLKAGSVTSLALAAEAVTSEKLRVDQAFFNKFTANEGYLRQLFAKRAFITQVQAVALSASRINGGLLASINGATTFNLQTGTLEFFTESPAIKRVLNGYPNQFIAFRTGSVEGKKTGVTIIGSNNRGGESSNDGGFGGIRIWNGKNTKQVELVGENIRLASSAYDAADGWVFRTKPGEVRMDPYRPSDKPHSRIGVGDVELYITGSDYRSLRDLLNIIIDNIKLLHEHKKTEHAYRYSIPTKF